MSGAIVGDIVGSVYEFNNTKDYDFHLFTPPKTDYNIALDEMKSGRKRSHWIWYIFPQLRGLGSSAYSYVYGLAELLINP